MIKSHIKDCYLLQKQLNKFIYISQKPFFFLNVSQFHHKYESAQLYIFNAALVRMQEFFHKPLTNPILPTPKFIIKLVIVEFELCKMKYICAFWVV